MSHSDLDPNYNTSDNVHFQEVLAASVHNTARRRMLMGSLGLAGLAWLPGCATVGSPSAMASTPGAST